MSVDNTQGIVTEDTTPLPPGTFSFAGVGNTSSTLFVDDVSLWMPTSELQATSTPTFTITPSATVTGEAPEPALRLIYNQSFDGSSDPFGELSRSIWPLKRVEPDYALYVTGAKRLTRVTHQSYTDVVSEARFFVSNGAGQLSIRQNGTGGYTASLNATGQIELYRNGTLIDNVPVGTPVVGQWYAIRLTAIADLVRVYVNNAEFIRFTDSSPLPDGMITFNGENLGNQPLLVDDLQVWVPDESLLTSQRLAPQSQTLLSAAEPSVWDYLKRNEIFISGFLYYMSYGTGNGEGGSISLIDGPGQYVALSPDGHQIAYNCSSDICVINVDGSGYFRVTNDLDYDNHPSWSPDGSQISFWSSREVDGVLTSGIWTINADGTNLQLLATSSQGYEPRWVGTTINNGIYYFVYGEGFYRYDPATESNQLVANETGEGVGKSDYAVSRSGDYWLAYTRAELLVPETYNQSILIVRNLSQGANEIVYSHTYDCYNKPDIYYPILSPDATYVTYFTDWDDCRLFTNQWLIAVNSLSSGTPVLVGGTTESALGYSGDWGYRSDPNPIPVTGKLAYVRTGSTGKDVWIMENWTDQQTQLSDSPFADTNPELSPGGQYVAFVTDRFGGGKEIVVKPVADGLSDEHLLRLTDNYEITDDSPTWSPNGQQIAFYSESPTSYGITIMNADGSSKQLVFAGSNITDLNWSPVGNELVYTSYDNYTDSYGIYTLDINNPVPMLLTSDPANERHPVWSPDGEQIAFTSDTGGRYNIYVMDADGSNVQAVTTTNHDGDNVYPAWSPDGSQIAFTSFSPEFSTDPYYNYSTTQTVLQIYQRDISQASSEMGLPLLSNSVAPMLLQSSISWVQVSWYATGQFDYIETAWRSLASVTVPPNACVGTVLVSVNLRSSPDANTNNNLLGSISANTRVWVQGQYPEGSAQWYYGIVIYNGLAGYFINPTPNIQFEGNCDNIWQTNNPDGTTPTPTATFTPSPTWDPAIPTPTPTMTPTPVPRAVAPAAQAFHNQHAAFGLPIPFNLWPVIEADDHNYGYGPNGFAAYDSQSICQTPPPPTPTPLPNATPGPNPTAVPDDCQYRGTNSIHTGVDFYTEPADSAVIALCDGIIIPGKIPWDGVGGGGSAAQNAGVGLSLRCFANDPFDTDGNGLRNLSNIVVVYNHLTLISGRALPANSGGPYQIVKAGNILARTTGYTTKSGQFTAPHLHLEMFIANGYQATQAIQINPRLMFSDPMARPYIIPPDYPYPQPYDEWWLQGLIKGNNLFFWQNSDNNPPFVRNLAAYLAQYYPSGSIYKGPNCDLSATATDYGIDSSSDGIKQCSVSSNDIVNAPTPAP